MTHWASLEEVALGLGGQESRETWPRSQWRVRKGKGQEPAVPTQSAKAAPGPLCCVFLSLSGEQLDLKKTVYMWVLDPLCLVFLCPEAVHMKRAQVLHFRGVSSLGFVF